MSRDTVSHSEDRQALLDFHWQEHISPIFFLHFMRLLLRTPPGKSAAVFLFFYRMLGELALQCPAMHLQGACGCRNIAIMLGKYFLQMLPFQALDR